MQAKSDANGIVVVPQSTYWDAAAGSVLVVGISAVFLADNSSLVDIPRLGIDIPLSTVAAQSNLPGTLIGGGYMASGPGGPRLNPRRGLVERLRESTEEHGGAREEHGGGARRRSTESTVRRRLVAQDTASLDFWSAWLGMLPAPIQNDVVQWLVTNANLTIVPPQSPLNAVTSSLTQLFDIELSVRGLLVENENAASIRLGSTVREGSDGSLTEGFIFQPVVTGFLSQTLQQAAAFGAAALRAGSGAVKRVLQPYLQTQLQPLPDSITLACDVLFRVQVSANGGDIASVQR